jgi:hypothetical protein
MRNGTNRQVTLLIVVDSISLGFTTWTPTICIRSLLLLVRKFRFDGQYRSDLTAMLVARSTGLCVGNSIRAARRARVQISRLELNLPTGSNAQTCSPKKPATKITTTMTPMM